MYINKSICISPQKTFGEVYLDEIILSAENKLKVIEPAYEGIPLNILRRMGKAVRMGVGAAVPILREYTSLNGIIIGTANGGMEDCIKFLNQVIEYNEGTLTPTNFVQSTTNAIAAQIGLTSHNTSYNITHVHRGLAFENALIDAVMQLKENPDHAYLVGGVDEISTYNFNIDNLAGWFKNEIASNADLYKGNSEGSISGEGVGMFVLSNKKETAIAKIIAVKTLHSTNAEEIKSFLQAFIIENVAQNKTIDLFLSGENGDTRHNHFYNSAEDVLKTIPVARFKHLCGDFATATAFAVWLAGTILETQKIPTHLIKNNDLVSPVKTIVIYNTYRRVQHSFILLEK